jgi:hypothetical protein
MKKPNELDARMVGLDKSLARKSISLFLKWQVKIIAWSVLGALLAALFVFSIFWYGERERLELLARYKAPPGFITNIISKKNGLVRDFMRDRETLVCGINSYARPEYIEGLNSRQRASLPKAKIPSEDLVWYLIFFNDDYVTRIYLIEASDLRGNISKCARADAKYEIRNEANDVPEITISE